MTATPQAPTPEERLAAIEADLRRHLAAADPPPEALGDLARRMEAVSRAVARMPPESAAACRSRARRILRLHDELALRFTQQRAETAEELARIRRGRATLKAYGENA